MQLLMILKGCKTKEKQTDHQVIELLHITLFRNNYSWGRGKRVCLCLCVGSRVVWMTMIQMSNNAVLFSAMTENIFPISGRLSNLERGLPCPFIYINQIPAEVMIYLLLHLHRPPSWYPFPRATFSLQSGEWSLSQGTVFPEILDGQICIIVSHHPEL